MSFREKIFIDKLFKDAKITLDRILRKRRGTFWGETPVLFRVRKYKVAGEVRNERVSVVKPQLHKVRLFSMLLNKQVELQTTPQMLRYIEASGGLDDYLLQTPDEKLMSDVASQLKVQLLQVRQANLDKPSTSFASTAQQDTVGAAGAAGAVGPAARASGDASSSGWGARGAAGAAGEGVQGGAAGAGAGGAAGQQRGAVKKDPAELAELQRVKEQLAVERRERITRMLQVAVTPPPGPPS